MDVICVFFLLSSPPRLSSVSVELDFNASPSEIAPVSPILLSVDLMKMKMSVLFVGAICVIFLLCLHLRLSFVSVVFDFNASLNDVAPVSPMLFSVDLMRIKKQ